MRQLLHALALAAVMAAGPVQAADFYTAGNSHCQEIARQLGKPWRSVAVSGASIADLPRQLVRVPFGAFVIVCPATNDAARDDMATASPFYAQAALDVAEWRSLRLVFIGPSAVAIDDGWRRRAQKIDGFLEVLLRTKGVPYISIFSDPARQPGSDKVHLTGDAYRALGAEAALRLD